MHAVTRFNVQAPRHPVPLAQVEVLLLFHPELQCGGPRRIPPELCGRAAQGWLTLDVFGRPGTSELTGRPVLEDLRLEVAGADVEAILPDRIVNEVADYVLAGA